LTAWLTAGVGVVYLVAAVGHFANDRVGLAVAFAAYALANVGLIMAEKGR
jgi:hypothetical protein